MTHVVHSHKTLKHVLDIQANFRVACCSSLFLLRSVIWCWLLIFSPLVIDGKIMIKEVAFKKHMKHYDGLSLQARLFKKWVPLLRYNFICTSTNYFTHSAPSVVFFAWLNSSIVFESVVHSFSYNIFSTIPYHWLSQVVKKIRNLKRKTTKKAQK